MEKCFSGSPEWNGHENAGKREDLQKMRRRERNMGPKIKWEDFRFGEKKERGKKEERGNEALVRTQSPSFLEGEFVQKVNIFSRIQTSR